MTSSIQLRESPRLSDRSVRGPCPRCRHVARDGIAMMLGASSDGHDAFPIQRGWLTDAENHLVRGVKWLCAYCHWRWIVLDRPRFNGSITHLPFAMTVSREDFVRAGYVPPEPTRSPCVGWALWRSPFRTEITR